MVKYSKVDLTLQTTIEKDEILKYNDKLHLPLKTTFAFANYACKFEEVTQRTTTFRLIGPR